MIVGFLVNCYALFILLFLLCNLIPRDTTVCTRLSYMLATWRLPSLSSRHTRVLLLLSEVCRSEVLSMSPVLSPCCWLKTFSFSAKLVFWTSPTPLAWHCQGIVGLLSCKTYVFKRGWRIAYIQCDIFLFEVRKKK